MTGVARTEGTGGRGERRRVVIMGAAGRDFHDFNTRFRDDPTHEVVAFTAAQIPGIDDRTYPAALSGPLYPDGVPIVAEEHLAEIVAEQAVDEVVFAYSDLSHIDVMHRASIALAAGADFRLSGPRATQLESTARVIAVCATRTGCGKSQTSRSIAAMLRAEGHQVAVVRHPMPYGDLASIAVQRFASLADIDASQPTVEEREEYEPVVAMDVVMYAGVDYEAILRSAEREADVLVWDGGNNDLPFLRPDIMVTVADALRPGDGLTHHPGEVNLRLADIVVVNKVDEARSDDVELAISNTRRVNPGAVIVRSASPVTLDPGPSLEGRRVLVVEDGPTITHGGMPYGAGAVAALAAGATELVDPRIAAVGSVAETFRQHPHIGSVLPAMGYGREQLAELEATIAAAECDVVVLATPGDLTRLVEIRHPLRRATYESVDAGSPTLEEAVMPRVRAWSA